MDILLHTHIKLTSSIFHHFLVCHYISLVHDIRKKIHGGGVQLRVSFLLGFHSERITIIPSHSRYIALGRNEDNMCRVIILYSEKYVPLTASDRVPSVFC